MGFLKNASYYLLLIAVGFLQFSNTLDYPYVWDDILVIERNPDVQNGIDGIPEIFRKQNTDLLHDQLGYRPVVLSTFALEQEFFGMDASKGHFFNVLFYAILLVVLYQLLVVSFFKERKLLALLIVLFYAVHPLHTEVVANIKSRDELFQFLFGALTLLNYVLWSKKKNILFLILAIISFGLAFLSKENSIAILGVIGVYILLFENNSWGKKAIGLFPWLAAGVVALMVMRYTLTTETGKEETEGWGIFFEDQVLGNSFMDLQNPVDFLTNGLAVLNRYLAEYFYPIDLVYYSGYNQIPVFTGFHWTAVLGVSTLAVLLIGAWYSYRKSPEITFGILFFLITLSPFLQIAIRMSDTMANRFMFAPTFGLSIVVVVLLSKLVNKYFVGNKGQKVLLGAMVALMLPYSALTYNRNKAWQNAYTLFSTDMPKLENCAKAHKYMANELFAKYEKTRERIYLDQTISHLERSIEISPKMYHAQLELGYNYGEWGNPGKGIEVLEKAVERFPESMDPHFFLGNLYVENGDHLLSKNQFRRCVEITPAIIDPYFLLANSHLELAEYDSAMMIANWAIGMWPGDIRFRDVKANLFLRVNEPDSAIKQVGQMLMIQPENPDLWKKLIGYYDVLGMTEEAQITYEDAIDRGILQPNN